MQLAFDGMRQDARPRAHVDVYGRPTGVFYFNQSLPLFQDVKVRKALQMAIDRETISASYFCGFQKFWPEFFRKFWPV
ncbi:MAG: ABC transporter substrate-binding protein [Spirochaetaceae bacterium]|nr:ABC transporter substrate-binding protein [Spirochaetaceae bacterium]